MKNLTGYDVDDLLNLAGLERSRSVVGFLLPALGCIALGAAVGAGVGLLFAPSSGRRFRQDMGDRFGQIRERMRRDAQQAQAGVNATQHQ
jgi:hypothetical protein